MKYLNYLVLPMFPPNNFNPIRPTIIFCIDHKFTFFCYYDDLGTEEMRQFLVTG